MPGNLRTLAPPAPSPSAPPAAPSAAGAPFRHDIQGLRAVAVLLVIAFHARIALVQGGYVGVDVFFVLSGYLITGLIAREIERDGRLDVAQFYARRARRLLPAAAVMLLATAAASALLLSPLEQTRVSEAASATALYASNAWFMWRTGDYFVAGPESNPLLHTWSLAVEEQFYLVWPLAVWLLFRSRSRIRLVAGMAVLSLVSLGLCLWMTEARQPWAFYASPTRGWEFGIGGMAAFIPAAWLHGRRRMAGAMAWAGAAGILLPAVLFSATTRFPAPYAALPALGTAALLVAGTGPSGLVRRMLETAPLQHLGRLSYSWYLWHWPAVVFAAALVPGVGPAGRAAASLAALGVAAVAFAWVEDPLRSLPSLSARPRRSLGLAALATVLLAGAMYGWHGRAQVRSLAPAHRAYTLAAEDGERGACLVPMRVRWQPECVAGKADGARTVVLFGDSHASHWFPAVERIATLRGWRLVTLMKSGCPAASVDVFNTRLRREYTECAAWRTRALARIRELRPSAVILSSALVYVRRPDGGNPGATLSYAGWRDGIRRTARAFDALGIRTVLLHSSPRPGVDVPACLSRARHWGEDPTDTCDWPRDRVLDPAVHRAERAAVAGLRYAGTVDLTPAFCGPVSCEAVHDGVVIYRDRSHLTAAFTLHMVPELMPRLVARVEGPPQQEAEMGGRGSAAVDSAGLTG